MVTDFDRESIHSIMANRPGFDWFTCDLLRLLAKADFDNREKIRAIFPDVVELFDQYKNGELA